MPRVLLGCYEVPGYGGASTSAYGLFELLQQDGVDITYLNLVDERDEDFYRYTFGQDYGNPRRLNNVFNCNLLSPVYFPHPELSEQIDSLQPDLIVGFGFIAALLLKRAAEKTKVIFVTTGCQQMKEALLRRKARDFVNYKKTLMDPLRRPDISCMEEGEAVEISDLIITHSESTLFLHRAYFPFQAGKMYSEVLWFAEWIYSEALKYSRLKKPFPEREIDVLFSASSWDRIEKNYEAVREIVKKANGAKIHVIGESEEEIPGAVHHGLISDRAQFFALMGNSKTVICPSLFDAAPGILFEGSALGCNLIASQNCGNWEICNDALLVRSFTVNEFLGKIDLAVSTYFEDNMNRFLSLDCYRNFKETILDFA